MELIIKNYVVSESKSFSYTLKNLCSRDLLQLFEVLLLCGHLFSFHKNSKSNVLSFYVNDLEEFKDMKEYLKSKFNC